VNAPRIADREIEQPRPGLQETAPVAQAGELIVQRERSQTVHQV